MKNRGLKTVVVLLSLLVAQAASGAAQSWDLDPNHSNFYFSVDHIYSKIRGQFNEFSGTVHFDPKDLAGSSMEFTILVKSIDTRNGKRDKHLQSKDFFDEGEYPEMRFTSTSIEEAQPNNYRVSGKFTVKGKEYDLVLPLTLAGVKQHPMKKEAQVAGFNGSVTIDRLKYGVGNGKFYDYGVVGKDVEIFVSLELLTKE